MKSTAKTLTSTISTSKCKLCNDTGLIATSNNTYKPCICRQQRKIKKQWNKFGVDLDKVKPIKDYKMTTDETGVAKTLAIRYVREYEEIKKRENNWLAFLGQAGAGKTHLVKAVGKALIEKGYVVRYISYVNWLKEAKRNAMSKDDYLKEFRNCEILIIDDLFKNIVIKGELQNQLTSTDMNYIFDVLEQRYSNSLPTIISSECTPNMLYNIDTSIGGRIIERCEMKIVFKKKESNYRQRF